MFWGVSMDRLNSAECMRVYSVADTIPYARSFRRRFSAYHHAVKYSLNDHLFGKELFILFAASAFRKLSSIYVFSYFPFGFEGRIWDLIVSVPDHCLSFYFTSHASIIYNKHSFSPEMCRKKLTIG